MFILQNTRKYVYHISLDPIFPLIWHCSVYIRKNKQVEKGYIYFKFYVITSVILREQDIRNFILL